MECHAHSRWPAKQLCIALLDGRPSAPDTTNRIVHARSLSVRPVGTERFQKQRVREIFAWGKHLVFQFDTFALRVHFMLWGTFAATVKGISVTGDYRRSGPPRLIFRFPNGEIIIWSASLKIIESEDAKADYDFHVDVLSDEWDPKNALRKVRALPKAEIADVLGSSVGAVKANFFHALGNLKKMLGGEAL